MLSESVQKALNAQINFELYSSYIYLSMAAWFEDKDLPGHASWMKVQATEELLHVEKFYHYIIERDGRVILDKIDSPTQEWDSPLAAFEDALKHEQEVSRKINKIVDKALSEGDHATNNFLTWFVNEQVEEEASVKDVVRQLKMIGNDGHGLFMLDKELRARVLDTSATTEA